MTGKELQDAVVELARTLGWRVAHFKPVLAAYPGSAKRWMTPVAADGKGFPDLLMVRERQLVVEIKGDKDRLRPDQNVWLSAFRTAGEPAVVWTPKDWGIDGSIEQELKRRERRHPIQEERLFPEVAA